MYSEHFTDIIMSSRRHSKDPSDSRLTTYAASMRRGGLRNVNFPYIRRDKFSCEFKPRAQLNAELVLDNEYMVAGVD